MGATLVNKAIQHWSHVSDRAFRVLMAMAVTAKDNGSPEVPAGLYFGGHDALVAALNVKPGTKPDSVLRTVRRAVEELEEVGAVRCTQRANLGSHAVYQMTLGNTPKPRQRGNSESTHFTNRPDTPCPTGPDTECPTRQDNPCPTRQDTPCPTYKEPLEEPLEELEKEEGVEVRTALTVTRARPAIDKPDSSPACRDPTCRMGYRYEPGKPKGQRNIRCDECNPSNVIPFGRKAA